MKTTVSEKGQITIPKPLRVRLGLVPGAVLDFETHNGELVGHKLVREDPGVKWRGRGGLPGNVSVDEYINQVRE